MAPGEHLGPFTAGAQQYNGTFLNKRNQRIYCYYWKSMAIPRALLLISHGFTEHSMMYDALAMEMARRGFFVFAHDHAGHGHSEGYRGYLHNMYDLVEDSICHINMVREEFPDIPLFICGHSLGANISILVSLEKEIETSGAVIIGSAFATNPETATFFRRLIAKFLNNIFPSFPVVLTDFNLSCQNKESVKRMNEDPLMYHGYWSVRTISCLLQSAKEILKKCSKVKFPFLILHGDADKVCHLSGATMFYDGATSEDKTLKIYPGAYHSLLHEPSEIADDVFNQTVQWLESHLN